MRRSASARARLFGLLTLAMASLAGPAAAQNAIAPAAVVNDQVVTNYDIDQRARVLIFNGAPQSPELARVAFDQLVEDALKLQAGEAAGVTADQIDLQEVVRSYAQMRGETVDQVEAGLRQVGADISALQDALTAEAVWREVVRRRFGGRAQPSEAEIDQEIELAASGDNVTLRLAEIAIPLSGQGAEEARALAERVSAELRSGGDFAAAARRYSASPSAAQGGEIGWLSRSSLPPEARAALADTQVGDVTRPIQTENAVAILQVLERREEPRIDPAAADDPERREEIREAMTNARLQRLAAGYLQELRGDAVIERR